MTPLVVKGIAAYRPRVIVASTVLDARFGQEVGWTERTFGISERAIAQPDETSSAMGASAAQAALAAAGWAPDGFDVLIGACGVMEQPIPSTGALIQRAMGLGRSGIPAFDVNQTCLSFLAALDIAAMGIETGRWRRAVVVSSDIASAGLHGAVPATAAIFGDGAAAAVRGSRPRRPRPTRRTRPARPRVRDARRWLPPGRAARRGHAAAGGRGLRGAGGRVAVRDGCVRHLPGGRPRAAAADRPGAGRGRADARHGRPGRLPPGERPGRGTRPPAVRRRPRMRASGRVVDIFATHGNQIAASLPTVLAHAMGQGLARAGTTVLLLGTAAGISAGAMVLRL